MPILRSENNILRLKRLSLDDEAGQFIKKMCRFIFADDPLDDNATDKAGSVLMLISEELTEQKNENAPARVEPFCPSHLYTPENTEIIPQKQKKFLFAPFTRHNLCYLPVDIDIFVKDINVVFG